MSLDNHVSLTITEDSVGIARAGFGVPLIASANASFPERIRRYSSLLDVADDFAVTTGPEYLAAQALFSQSPCPEEIAIGRCALPPTQKYSLDVIAVRNSSAYALTVDGDGVTSTDVSITSGGAATQEQIHSALLTALNAVVGRNFLATFTPLVNADDTFVSTHASDLFTATAHGLLTGDGPFQCTTTTTLPAGLSLATDYWIIRLTDDTFQLATSLANALAGTAVAITTDGTGTHTISDTASTVRASDPLIITGTATKEWFSIEVVDITAMAILQDHVDPGLATDLTAIALEDNDWYALITLYNSDAYVKAAAAWVEANKKIYIADINDSLAVTQAVGGGDTMDDLFALTYARTMVAYHPSPASMFAAAWFGRVLPLEPGSESWKFKTLSGVTAVSLTGTHRTNLVNKNGNSYQTNGGRNITIEGTTCDGDFMDVTRGLDWLDDDMTAAVFGALAGADKIPYTDAGVAVVENEVRGSLKRAIRRGILADDPAPVVTVPKVADVSTGNRASRILPDVKFTGTLAGAIHKVVIIGKVSV